jgi:hypothetical protein
MATKKRRASIHLIRIPDREARIPAFQTLVDLEEMWVRLRGNLFGVSTKQVEALEKNGIDFEWVSKTGPDLTVVE